jgi:hypothetical protein
VADQERGTDDPRLAAIARHALHDEELIAALAAGDLEDADAERARAIVERCSMCRELHQDLAAIRAMIRASGTAEQRAATLSAPRDFRLTADAVRLRPGSPVARLAVRHGFRDRLGLGIAAFGRPVGAALATFGVAGLLIGSLTLGGTALVPMAGSAGSAPTSAPGIDQSGSVPEASDNRTEFGPLSTGQGGKTETGAPGSRDGTTPGSLLLLGGSLVLLLVGVGLFLAARRPFARVSAPRGN